MIGKRENVNRCPFCGGQLREGKATVPFVFQNSVIVVKGVPAEICANCHEPLMTGAVTDELTALLRQLRAAGSEVSVVSYQRQLQPVLVLAEEREKYGEE
jgi:YgiT-type zinc finger domain-containing protein